MNVNCSIQAHPSSRRWLRDEDLIYSLITPSDAYKLSLIENCFLVFANVPNDKEKTSR